MAPCCDAFGRIQNACAGGRKASTKVIKAWYACADDVQSIPAVVEDTHEITGDIVMADGKTFHQIDLDSVGSSYKFTSQGEGQAKEYINTIIIFIADVHKSVSKVVSPMPRGSIIYILEDKNGNRFLVGAINDGAETTVDAQSEPRNGYILTAAWPSADLPYDYSGAIPLEA